MKVAKFEFYAKIVKVEPNGRTEIRYEIIWHTVLDSRRNRDIMKELKKKTD